MKACSRLRAFRSAMRRRSPRPFRHRSSPPSSFSSKRLFRPTIVHRARSRRASPTTSICWSAKATGGYPWNGSAASRHSPLEAFFVMAKQATIRGYYTSKIGIHDELHYKGNVFLKEFVGCETENGKDCPHCGQKHA